MFLVACGGSAQLGGRAEYHETVTTDTTTPEGQPVHTVTEKSLSVAQPESPDGSATLSIKPTDDGKGLIVAANTGGAHNNVKTLGTLKLLEIPMYFGAGLIVIGILVGIFANRMWGIIIAGCGAIMIIGSWLLAEYSIYFMFGLGILVVYGLWLVRDYILTRKANEELVIGNQIAKATGAINTEKFHEISKEVQSKTTATKVAKIKGT